MAVHALPNIAEEAAAAEVLHHPSHQNLPPVTRIMDYHKSEVEENICGGFHLLRCQELA